MLRYVLFEGLQTKNSVKIVSVVDGQNGCRIEAAELSLNRGNVSLKHWVDDQEFKSMYSLKHL